MPTDASHISPSRKWIMSVLVVLLLCTGCSAPDPTGAETASGPPWPPSDTQGQFQPMPESAALNQDVQACGTTVQLRSVPGARGEYKATVQDDGTTRVDFRGTPKADITRVSDGAVLRGLPAGGEGSYELYSSDGKQVTYSFEGPHVYGAFDETEAKVFSSHGLPAVFTYESGTLTERVVFGDREGNRVVSAEIEQNTVTGVQDICRLLDEAMGTKAAS